MSILQDIIKDTYKVTEYSGRGMFGKSCLGVQIDGMSELGALLAAIIEKVSIDNRAIIAEDISSIATDSLGKGVIVYFSKVEFLHELIDEDSIDENDGHAVLRNLLEEEP